jgi:riboflavin-specific deaminase-like protein
MRAEQDLPFVSLNVASSVDGKLAPHTRHFVPFSSPRDQRLLLELRSHADAVMAGARTVDLGLVDLGPGPAPYRRRRLRQGLSEYNLRVVVSGGATLNPKAEIFRHRFSPIIVLAAACAPTRRLKGLRQVADEVAIFGEDSIDFVDALCWLRRTWNVRLLLCEGGGEVNAALFRQGVVDQVHLTLSPLVFGGREAPTMADGRGISEVSEASRLRLKSLRRFGDELFLVYRVLKGARLRNLQPDATSETPSEPRKNVKAPATIQEGRSGQRATPATSKRSRRRLSATGGRQRR